MLNYQSATHILLFKTFCHIMDTKKAVCRYFSEDTSSGQRYIRDITESYIGNRTRENTEHLAKYIAGFFLRCIEYLRHVI